MHKYLIQFYQTKRQMAGINKAHAKQKVPQGSTHTHTQYTQSTHMHTLHTLLQCLQVWKLCVQWKYFVRARRAIVTRLRTPLGALERGREREMATLASSCCCCCCPHLVSLFNPASSMQNMRLSPSLLHSLSLASNHNAILWSTQIEK